MDTKPGNPPPPKKKKEEVSSFSGRHLAVEIRWEAFLEASSPLPASAGGPGVLAKGIAARRGCFLLPC